MADLKKFREKVDELCKRRKIKRPLLANKVGISSEVLSRRLNGREPLTPEYVRRIVMALAELNAIQLRRQAEELLRLMDCNVSDTDWLIDPLNKLKPDPLPARSIQQHTPLPNKQLSDSPTISALRNKYLEKVSKQYSTFTLPIGKRKDFSLQAVFLPLKLRRDPLVAEDLVYEERRALLDEPTRGEHDPRRALPERYEPPSYKRGEKEPEVIIANDADDAIRKSPTERLIILGSPGTGKTTALKRLAGKAAKQAKADASSMIPIYVSLPDLADSGQALEGYLPTLLGNLGIDLNYADILWQEIQEGHAYICLDSLDEVPTNQREKIIEWVNTMASDQGNVWIIGSRFSQYKTGQFHRSLFSEWELQPLTPELRQALADQLLPELYKHIQGPKNARGGDPSLFLHALEKHPRASTWGKNPLLFSLAALVFVYYGSIPSSRATLYQQVIDAVLETRQKDDILRTMVRKVVSSLALALYQEKKRTFTHDDLLRLLPTIREQQKENWATEELARQLINSGVFEVVARGTYSFWHQTFLEYLTATELAQALVSSHTKTRKQFWQLARSKRTFSRWSEVLRLVVGILVYEHRREGTQKALEWLHALVAQRSTQEGDIGDLGLTLAIRSLSEIEETANLWKDEAWLRLEEAVANTWTEAVLEAADRGHEVRQVRLLHVGREISHFNPFIAREVANRLTASFPDKNARIRKVVLQALGKLGKYAPVNFLMQTLDDKHSKVREAAAYALAELEEYAPVDALIQVLERESTVVRVAATLALGEMRRIPLLEHLLSGLDDEEYSVREATVKALGKLGEHAPVEELVEMLDDENDLVRLATVETLGALGEKTYNWLTPLLDDPYDLVRAEVIKILGKHTPVLKLIEEVTRPRAFVTYSLAYPAAADVLAELEEQDILSALTAVENTKGQDLWALIQSIRESRQETPTAELIEAIYNFGIYKNECLSAAYILGRRNEWELLEQFFASLDNQHGFIRAIAVRVLGRWGEHAPVNLLLEASTDKNAAARLAAVKALEDLEDHLPPEAISVVILLNDEHTEIRASALRVLAQVLGHVEVKMPLLETLLALSHDRDEPVRDAAKICLEKLAPRVTADLIDGLFRHQDLLLRQDSIRVFGRYASFNQIVTSLQDSEPKVREAAIHVLGQRREQAAINLLFAALKDRNVAVHRAAIQALERLGQREALAKWYDKDKLYPLQVQTDLALRDFKEWRILAKLCDIEELLTLYETGTIPLEYLQEWDASMQFYSELFGSGSLMAVNTQTSEQQKLTDLGSANLDEMYGRLYRKALAVLKKRATVDRLLVALNHENVDVRVIALHVLAERTPMEQLIAALDDESSQVRREALQILGERTPINLLVAALNDEFDIVREAALELLKQRREHMPEKQLIEGLESSSGSMRASAVKVLERRMPAEKLKAMLGDSEEEVRLATADALRQAYPETLHALVPELAAVFRGEGASAVLASAAKSFTVEIIKYMENASSFLIDKLTPLLDWPYWEVRMRAAQVLGKLRRNIPEEAIRRLLELRNDPESQAVYRAADDALAEILSLETGIEDED